LRTSKESEIDEMEAFKLARCCFSIFISVFTLYRKVLL
jgi:hypothetical protein